MRPISFKRHRFPPDIIRHAVWLYFRFTLSFRNVEEMLAQRGIEVSYETVRCWTTKFGPLIARNLKRKRPAPSPRWHLDEVVCTIGGKRMYLWRAVDDEGEVLDVVVQKRRDHDAALRLLKRLLRNQPVEPEAIFTDGLASYGSALRELGLDGIHRPGRLRENNRGREFSPADPKARAEDAALQIPELRPAFPHHSRQRLQHLLHPASSDQPRHAPDLSECGE